MAKCRYCGEVIASDEALTEHFAETHNRDELSRIDQKRVEQYTQGEALSARLRDKASVPQVSRRGVLTTVGVGAVSIISGFGGVTAQTGPIEITDWNDLDDIRNNLSETYVLANDLDKDTAGYAGIGDDWTPVGTTTTGFDGEFDGNGNTISDLTIDTTVSEVGLFGKIDSNGIVKNIVLKQVDVTGGGSFGRHIGGVFGYSNGTVETSFVTGSVSSPSSQATARVGGVGGRVGTDGSVTECGADVTVEATNSGGEIGGLLGQVWQGGVVEDSYATGDVTGDNDVGGLVGIVSPSDRGDKDEVRRCYATGDVTGSTSSTTGGLVGKNGRGTTGLVEKSYWDKGTTNRPDAIGTDSGDSNTLIGYGSTGDTEPASEMQGSEAEANMSELDFVNIWETVETSDTDATNDGYPILQNINRASQLGVEESSAVIVVKGDNVTLSNNTIRAGGDSSE